MLARLVKIGLRNFKSFGPEYQEIDFRPLTVLIGRNSSGKSTLLQALLLLKQTLEHPRQEVQLHLEGPYVEALSLRELAHGWPGKNATEGWPEITIEWETEIKTRFWLGKKKGEWQLFDTKDAINTVTLHQRNNIKISFVEHDQRIFAKCIDLSGTFEDSEKDTITLPTIKVIRQNGDHRIEYNPDWIGRPSAVKVDRALSHFMPDIMSIFQNTNDKYMSSIATHSDPLTTLSLLLQDLHYLGASRTIPPSIYKAASSPLDDVGVSGEYAAQLLHQRQTDVVHYRPLVQLPAEGPLSLPDQVLDRPLLEAVNHVMQELGLQAQFSLQEIQDIGFRLLCSKTSVQHVGRGVGYLLPVVIAGLVGDPAARRASTPELAPHLLLEEVDMHTHPKVQSRLAHFFVSMALSGRQIMVETHSDHMVRRLRRLIAAAAPGSAAERWLMENVNLVLVEQDDAGVTRLKQSSLRPGGNIGEYWPSDFLDEAPDEERAIYFAGADRAEAAPSATPAAVSAASAPVEAVEIEHDPPGDGDEDE